MLVGLTFYQCPGTSALHLASSVITQLLGLDPLGIPSPKCNHSGGWLAMLYVVAGLVRLQVCLTFEPKECFAKGSVVGLRSRYVHIVTHGTLDCNVALWPRVIQHN